MFFVIEKKKEEIERNTGTVIRELGTTEIQDCNKVAREYIESQDIKDIVWEKQALSDIRIKLIKRNIPSQKEFVLSLIEEIQIEKLHTNITALMNVLGEMAQ